MRILGIDCGLDATGYGVIDVEGRRGRLIAAGVIRTSPADPLPERLSRIYRGLREIIERHRPERAAVESVFHSVNSQSALKLAHARGVSLLAAAESELATAEYSPLEIKQSVVGYGRAAKDQVQMMTASLLGLAEPVRPHDASDALAAALCDATLFPARALMSKRGA